MSLPPPRARSAPQTGVAQLDYEILQEQATALGRLGRALEAALGALTAFDGMPDTHSPDMRRQRAILVSQASHALWQFVVQREACGLRDTRQIIRDYRVPPEVQNRMGSLPAQGWR